MTDSIDYYALAMSKKSEYRQQYKNMSLYITADSKLEGTCDYKYNIYNGGAFKTKKGLKNWLKENNLKLGKRSGRMVKIIGEYYNTSLLGYTRKEFDEKFEGCKKSSVLDNAAYRRAYIDTSKGFVEKYYLNVNCKDAEILPYEVR